MSQVRITEITLVRGKKKSKLIPDFRAIWHESPVLIDSDIVTVKKSLNFRVAHNNKIVSQIAWILNKKTCSNTPV